MLVTSGCGEPVRGRRDLALMVMAYDAFRGRSTKILGAGSVILSGAWQLPCAGRFQLSGSA